MLRTARTSSLLFLLLVLAFVPCADVSGGDLESLRVLDKNYPQAFFFRSAEGAAANQRVTYESWDSDFSRLMGIEGKVLDEEVVGRSVRNIEFFTRFKKDHPEQLVMMHYNGNARDPRYQTEKYFAGHWVYFNGTTITADVPAEEGETEIAVDDPTLFRTDIGRYKDKNEDIGLCSLDAQGKPDWSKCEQVELVSIDAARKVIRVRRGCYGTSPLAFAAGKSYAAAHAYEGPWGSKSNLMWFYNYSTRCPRDENGQTCAEVHAEELSRRFAPDGELAAFDGLEFDVLHNQAGHGRQRGRGTDCDNDGQPDGGLSGGVNTYGVGVVEFCRLLRRKLGPQRLILADGMSVGNQRAFDILNGIESEGWPRLSDWEINDWSGGLNRHLFWSQNAHEPVFNYINHKFTTSGEKPGSRVTPEVPMTVHRLVFAVATFTDSAVCYSFSPPAPRGEFIGIWDELRMGTENRLGWLGRPLGPAVRPAAAERDLLNSAGSPITPQLAERFTGGGVKMKLDDGRLVVTNTDAEAERTSFSLHGVPCDGSDLFVSVTASAQPRQGHPAEMARMMWVGVGIPESQLVRADLPESGICIRGQAETTSDRETGGTLGWSPAIEMGGGKHDCYRVHPPYRDGKGYAFWQRDVSMPADARLELFTGMGELSPERSDGVTFRVLASVLTGGEPGPFETLLEHSQKAHQWVPHSVSLAAFSRERVRLKFISDCGPNDNSTTDHSYWGDVVLVDPNDTGMPTAPARYMSWLGRREFTAGFYLHEVCSDSIDLVFDVEGTEPIWIKSISVHAHPDVIYREFENGLVLANPSPRPYVFDLPRLFPGVRFRRLQGSVEQDPQTNDGSPVTGKLTLAPKAGLFLVKEPAAN